MPKIPGVNHLDAVRALEKTGFRILPRVNISSCRMVFAL